VRRAYARANAAIVRRNIIFNMKLSRLVLIEQATRRQRNNAAQIARNICRYERPPVRLIVAVGNFGG
jgi:hypothetical protein